MILGTASVKLAISGTAIGIGTAKVIDKITQGLQKAKNVITGATDTYRSVGKNELAKIKSTQQFNLPSGGMEAKQFGLSYTEILRFGSSSFINQTDIVRVSVPNNLMRSLCNVSVDPSIFRSGTITVYAEMFGESNNAVSGTI